MQTQLPLLWTQAYIHTNTRLKELDVRCWSKRRASLKSKTNLLAMYAPTYRFVPNTVAGESGVCAIRFSVPIELQAPIFLYYRLTNFYQNHRKYVKSLSYNQLHGDVITPADAASSCSPVATEPGTNKIYYPCGLIANSMFNGECLITKKKKRYDIGRGIKVVC